MATISKSYVKKVLFDEAELDRLQQGQLREYSPELATLARMKSDMDSILRHSKLSPQDKITTLAALQGRFEKIRKDAGVLSSAATIALAPQVAETPPTANADDESANEEEDELKGDSAQEEDIPDFLSPISKYLRHLGVKGQYERKARNVMLKSTTF